MKLAVVSKIRNEIDIIDPFLRHLGALFDSIYLLDHRSMDGTSEILKSFAQQKPGREYFYLDFNGHFQKQVANLFMQKAFLNGADYLFNLDADEFLQIKDREELEQLLEEINDFDGVGSFNWRNCIPTDFDSGLFSTTTPIWAPEQQSSYAKVVVGRKFYEITNHKIEISQGNHHVMISHSVYAATKKLGSIIHVPLRSREQAELKVIIKSLAYLAIDNRNTQEGFHNFEMLNQIAKGQLDDNTLRGFTYLYEKEKKVIPLPEPELFERGYEVSSLERLKIPFSNGMNISSNTKKVSANALIANSLINWGKEDPAVIDFVLEEGVIRIVEGSTNKKQYQNTSPEFGTSDKAFTLFKKLVPSRIQKKYLNQRYKKLIQSSKLFDSEWYLHENPDVAEQRIDPIIHYIENGASEGRNPGPLFDGNRYLYENNDVDLNQTNPLIHYIKFGLPEGREIFPVINSFVLTDKDTKDIESTDYYGRKLFLTIQNPSKKNVAELGALAQPEVTIENISIDVVICVHNSLVDVKNCLESVIPTLGVNDNIILVDDQSDIATKNYLLEIQHSLPEKIKLLNTPEQYYYARSANLGLAESTADFVILLNSDTIVSEGWVTKLASLAYQDPKIGIVGPLSNAAGMQSIPSIARTVDNSAINQLPISITIGELDQKCEEWAKDFNYPLLPYVHGFCLCLKREVKEKIGYFDVETFPKGYSEEIDYCVRAEDAGFKMVVATNTYVFHAKSKSYDPQIRRELMKDTSRLLQKKYSRFRVQQAHNICKYHSTLVEFRKLAEAYLSEQ
jgi:GT2 family glycosyltransferase